MTRATMCEQSSSEQAERRSLLGDTDHTLGAQLFVKNLATNGDRKSALGFVCVCLKPARTSKREAPRRTENGAAANCEAERFLCANARKRRSLMWLFVRRA